MQECSLEHLHMGTARMKLDKDTEEEGKKRRVNIEGSTSGMTKRSSDGPAEAEAYTVPPGSLLPKAVDELPT